MKFIEATFWIILISVGMCLFWNSNTLIGYVVGLIGGPGVMGFLIGYTKPILFKEGSV